VCAISRDKSSFLPWEFRKCTFITPHLTSQIYEILVVIYALVGSVLPPIAPRKEEKKRPPSAKLYVDNTFININIIFAQGLFMRFYGQESEERVNLAHPPTRLISYLLLHRFPTPPPLASAILLLLLLLLHLHPNRRQPRRPKNEPHVVGALKGTQVPERSP